MIVPLQINQINENPDNIKLPQVKEPAAKDAKFKQHLDQSIKETSDLSDPSSAEWGLEPTQASSYGTMPSWVDPTYGFDPLNPRKPNMKELMEAMSGSSVEELYEDPTSNWLDLSSQASELLYGVASTVIKDTRNWEAIMASNDIVSAARVETGTMLGTRVKIETNYNNDNKITEQFAILSDKNDNALRTLVGPVHAVERTLLNFGATESSIPQDFYNNVDLNKFDKDIFALLEKYKGNSKSIAEIGEQSSINYITPSLSENIGLEMIEKL